MPTKVELAFQKVKVGSLGSPEQHLGVLEPALLQLTGMFPFYKLAPVLAKPFPRISFGNDLL